MGVIELEMFGRLSFTIIREDTAIGRVGAASVHGAYIVECMSGLAELGTASRSHLLSNIHGL